MWEGITPIPNSTFMRKLKRFDPNLDCEFNREVERFIITQPSRLGSGRLVACVVQNRPDRDFYRQPDDRDIHALARADFERKDHKRRIIEGEEYMRGVREKEDAYAEDEIMHATRENRHQLKHMADVVSGRRADAVNPAFRRVQPKSKGYTVKDRRKLKTA